MMTTEATEEFEQDDDSYQDYITPETRREVLERDGWRCRKCGEENLDKLTLHHVIYRSQSGGHAADNLVTICWDDHKKIHDHKLYVTRIDGHWYFREAKPNWMRRSL